MTGPRDAPDREGASSALAAFHAIRLLRAGMPVSVTALGSSMWPVVPGGSRIALEPCDAATLAIGELGAYERGDGALIIHRLLERRADGSLVFKGDSLQSADPPIRPAAFLARATVRQRKRLRLALPSRTHAVMAARSALSWITHLVRRTQSRIARRR